MLLSSIRSLAPILAGLAVGYAGPCGAQAVDQKPSAAAPAQIIPEDTAPGRSGNSQEPLGKKLDRTDEVIHPPPGVDPGLTISPPHVQGNMPVLPPPGTPGADPSFYGIYLFDTEASMPNRYAGRNALFLTYSTWFAPVMG